MTAYVLERKQYWKYGIGTEPNVALVGSPTISNAVASGFTSNSYLKIGSFNPQNNPWEAVFKFTVANVTTYQFINGSDVCGFYLGINRWQNTTSKLSVFLSATSGSFDIGEFNGVTTLVNGNTYWVKLLFTGSQYQLLLSDNAAFENATIECSVDSTKVISPWNDTVLGGVYENGVNSRPWQGSIDLTQSYIKINNKIWWYGTKAVKSTKDNYDFTTGKAYILKRKRPKEYRKKVIDTATAGTYTFDVAKDTTARIILVGGGGGGGNVWVNVSEGGGGGSGACVYCIAKLKSGTYTITNGRGGGENVNGVDSTLSLNDTTLITAGGGSHGLGGNYNGGYGGAGGTYTIADDVEIEKNIIVSNGNTGGTGYNMVGASGGASVYKGYGKGGGGSSGTGTTGYIFVELTTDETDYDYKIDNDDCYVLKRKQYWKYGTEPNVTVVGSPTIDDGVVSGFSASNYLTLPEVFKPQNNTWEQVWSVATGANTSTTYQEILAQSNVGTAAVSGYDLRVDAGKIILYVEGTAFTGATVLQDYTKYLIKAQYTGSAYILSYSTDNGASWVEDCNVASTVTGVPDMNVPQYVGVWKSTYSSTPDKAWLGSIDLSQSYININGSRWWSGVKAVPSTKDDYDFITD